MVNQCVIRFIVRSPFVRCCAVEFAVPAGIASHFYKLASWAKVAASAHKIEASLD
jgi:hypothetical protein